MPDDSDHSGKAALTICEALLLAEHEIVGLLRDAAATHENATRSDSEKEAHRAAASLINEIIVGGYPVRRS